MLDRRAFLGAIRYPAAAAAAVAATPVLLGPEATARAASALGNLAVHEGSPESVAGDEDFWREVQLAFTPDRTLVNLNNGGVSPAPLAVQEAMKRHLDLSNTASAYVLWQLLQPRREVVREGLARLLGCDPEEVAITRNASEGLENCQLGLDLRPGDEVVTTNQDYPRMLQTWRQRERRDGTVLRTISLPVPCEDPARVVSLFEDAITPKTRVVLMCHVINLTGQVLPVREVIAMARRRSVPVIVDGAHSFAHLVFRRDDLDCDYFATSLHKWLFAPHGTGLLYVRRERIGDLWPLLAAPESMRGDIRKFEETGTRPEAPALAVAEALLFHEALGGERKLARLVRLRDRWATRLLAHDRVRLHTSLEPGFAGGIATFEIDGVDPEALSRWLWERHRILTVAIVHEDFRGVRVSPSVYTAPEELDRFCEAVEEVLRHGLPRA